MSVVPPGLGAVTGYCRAWLARHMTAGVVLTMLLVPQGAALLSHRRGRRGRLPRALDQPRPHRERHPRAECSLPAPPDTAPEPRVSPEPVPGNPR
jgi:hypothetical protein